MAGDNLREILALARQDQPDVPDAVWQKFERLMRLNYGTQRLYIAAHRKGQHLEALAAADDQMAVDKLAVTLNVSVRHVHRLRKLMK